MDTVFLITFFLLRRRHLYLVWEFSSFSSFVYGFFSSNSCCLVQQQTPRVSKRRFEGDGQATQLRAAAEAAGAAEPQCLRGLASMT